jgi:hypothetical protein
MFFFVFLFKCFKHMYLIYIITLSSVNTKYEGNYFERYTCKSILILWCTDPLLGKDLETNNETTTVAMHRCDKHASTTIELLLETVFSTRSVQRGYKEYNWGGQAYDRSSD